VWVKNSSIPFKSSGTELLEEYAMITQTLEWHRFGDESPEPNQPCVIIYNPNCWPQFGYLSPNTVHGARKYKYEWAEVFDHNEEMIRCKPEHLWAYWVEPKEAGE